MPLRLRLLPSPGDPSGGSGSRATPERAVELPEDTREIRIGRRSDIEVPLPYPALSSLHARLTRGGNGGWQVEDLGSTNGTSLNGEPLAPHQPRPITPGAQIGLGPVTLVFDGSAPTLRGSERTASIARRLVADLLAAAPDAGAPVLAIVEGVAPSPPLRLTALDRRYVIGRGETCDMRLSSDEVSREHAAIVRRWDGVVIQDLGSKNGVSVNHQTGDELRVRDGDLVRMGPATLRLSDPADRYLRELEAQERDTTATETARPARATLRTGPRPVVARRSNTALRAAIAVATGVLVMVAAAVLMLALGR
jgi:pSer/pThr/pTyr-binding forkhead associated (FHA) protein